MISKVTQIALKTLGALIKAARQEAKLSQQALAERLQSTRQTVAAIEKGDPKVSIGAVFEAAYLLNVPLFSQDKQTLSKWQSVLSDFSALLPQKIHHKKIKVNNEF